MVDAGWLLGQLAFAFTFYKVQPAVIVDKAIEIALDLIVPGRGAGESKWYMRQYRNLEQSSEKYQRELDIRSQLRQWDEEIPWMHHELIVRYIAGLIVSGFAVSMYQSIVHSIRGQNRKR